MKKLLSTLTIVLISAAAFATGVVATAIGTNPGCNGSNNGSATAFASGGIGPYGFTWTGPSGYTGTGASISGLYAGTYIVTATDSSDMSIALYTLLLTQPTAIATSVTGGTTICSGGSTTLTATVTGGTGPYMYVWTPATGLSSSTIYNPVVSITTTTTYTVLATDASGCSGTATVTVLVNPSPTISISPFAATCGACNGFVSNSTTGASTYSWASSTGFVATTATITGLCPGTYTLTASNTFGCSATGTTTVVNTLPVYVTTGSVTPSTCGACNGGTNIVSTGGTPPYQYSVIPGGPTPAVVTGLCTGTYTVNVTDGNGCTAVNVFTVGSTPAITALGVTITAASCGASNGTATIGAATGGVAPYSYSVNGGAFSATTTYTGLAAGSYPATVKDANGCSYTTSFIITNSSGPTAAAITTVNTGCATSIGEIHIGVITGGTAPYTYSVNGGAFSATTDYVGLPAGTYPVAVKDSPGCIYTQAVTIFPGNLPVITLDSMQNIYCSNGSIHISVSGGTPGYTYMWSPAGTTTEDLLNINIPGGYTVNVTDAGGCTASHYYNVTHISSLYPNLSSISGNCGSLGTLSVAPTGGTAPYTYVWNTIPVQTTATVTGVPSGNYSCTITDSTGCFTTAYTNIYNSCYNIIKGTVYNDVNTNCTKDPGEAGWLYQVVYATGSTGTYYGSTDANGNYTIATGNMNNVVTAYNTSYSYPYTVPTCPVSGSQNVNFTTPGDTISNTNFGYYANPAYFDLCIHPGWSSGSPGFTKQYWICYYNHSPTPQNAVLRFVYDSVLQYVSCTEGGVHYPAQHKIEWTFTGLPPASSWVWATRPIINFNVPSTVSVTTPIHSYFEITPIAGDAYPSDNTLTSVEPITGCHDPNSMLVNPLGTGAGGDILQADSVLTYTVHFQNNGNDTAHFVEVRDTLPHFLEPLSVVPGAADHAYTYNLSGEGILTFRFDNIMLPDSTTDEPASSGYFTYTVHVKHGTPVGSVINNNASIYFDYNLPVVTNTAINTIVDVSTGIETASSNNAVKVFPNPFNDNTTFVIRSDKMNETYSFEMTDVLGKTVQSIKGISGKQFTVSRNGLQSGIYFYKIIAAGKNIGTGKLIIQ
ncbi:MAG: hypothetical protein JWP12_2245 [Bacteroidetes bacterium]|nr:hypothetical protein [Bacteroidota bacterium]